MFFEMRFDLGKLDSGERSLSFELLVSFLAASAPFLNLDYIFTTARIFLFSVWMSLTLRPSTES